MARKFGGFPSAEAQRAYHRKWHAEHREARRRAQEAWKAKNPTYQAEYRAANRERIRAGKRKSEAKRRAVKRGLFAESVDPIAVLIRDAGVCGICGLPVDADYHIDHVTPLSRGGVHSYANVQLAHAVCNLRKGNRV